MIPPLMDATSCNIVIASCVAPNYVGGLASYIKLLAQGLGKYDLGLTFVCLEENHQNLPACPIGDEYVIRQFGGFWWKRAWRPLLLRLASRPFFHPLLEILIMLVLPLKKVLRLHNGKISAIHFVGTGWDLVGFALERSARRANIPFTISPAVHPGNWGDDKIDIRFYSKADTIFCFSEYERLHLAKLGVAEKKLALCGLPPMCRSDGDRNAFRAELKIGERPAVFFLGRRDEGKGYLAILKAWSLVLGEIPNSVLILAGPGGEEFEGMKSALVQDSWRDVGVVSEKTKADAYAACDVFCLPSRYESFGIVYVEAWSYGKPVICGTAPACRQLVGNGVTGIWSEQNPTQLATDLVHLLQHPETASKLGEAGRKFQTERFTVEAMVQTHLRAWNLV